MGCPPLPVTLQAQINANRYTVALQALCHKGSQLSSRAWHSAATPFPFRVAPGIAHGHSTQDLHDSWSSGQSLWHFNWNFEGFLAVQ